MSIESACGSWASPVSSADLVRGALRLSAPRIEGGRLFWIEGRPDEGGRQVLASVPLPDRGARPIATDEIRAVTPAGVGARSRVHEYGGGEYTALGDKVWFVSDSDQRIWGGRLGESPRPLVAEGSAHADLLASPDGRWLFAVEERPREGQEPENRIIAIPLDAAGQVVGSVRVVASGHDFYAGLCMAPARDRLAWIAWDHPNMPWNGTTLEAVGWSVTGATGTPRKCAGGPTESLFQPRFAPDGALYVVTDASGWWNLARLGVSGLVPVHQDAFEVGRPQWQFGMSSWTFVAQPEGGFSVFAGASAGGVDRLLEIDPTNGAHRDQSGPLVSVSGLTSGDGWIAWIGSEVQQGAALYLVSTEGGEPVRVRESSSLALPDAYVSHAEAVTLPSVDGRSVHAFVYAPRAGDQKPRAGERPPLLVKGHGGPTAATSAGFDPRIQYWTSRGFAVADVNYGGSTGYGRAYRDQLAGAWGVVDVEDCVEVARALAAEGRVDADRLAISGGSAGGYTVLSALTFHDVFSAGASHYGIGDLEALARDTHKFESRYTDWLVGPLPETQALYQARSPVHHVEGLACPVIFFQGLEDKVVPPNQAEAMVQALAERGIAHAYVPFEGEQHGFRKAENIRTALDGELYFYAQVFGFDAPRPAAVEVVTPH